MVTVTIDGKTFEVPEGTTLLRAAQSQGIDIPTLCDHPHLTPYGGCRLCLVEVEGARTLQPSCTLPVSPNMVVKTDTKRVLDARRFVLTLIFSERNHFCPYCQVSGGDCELQNAAYHEGMTHWPLQPNWTPYPMDASHPYIIMENNRCILCRRCVRACGELIGNYTLGFEERGAKSILVADTGVPLGESTCISCGSCVQVCPTGALIDRWSAYHGHETAFDVTKTICVGCSVGCGIDVLSRDNNLVRVEGNWDAAVNEGVICEVGRFKPLADKCDRVVTPMIRKNGTLKAATWDEAISAIQSGLTPLKGKKSDGLAALVSTRLPAETLYAFKQLFGSHLDAEIVTTIEDSTSYEAISSYARKLGKSFESNLAALESSDGVMVLSVDLVKDHQVAGFFVKRNLAKGTRLLVLDENENGLDAISNKSIKPGKAAKADVLKGLSAAVVKLGLAKGPTALKVEDLDKYAAKTGISTDDYLDAAFVIASAEKPVVVYDRYDDLPGLLEFAALINAELMSVKGLANTLTAAQLGLEKVNQAHDYQAAFIALGDDEISQKLHKEIEKIPYKVVVASYSTALTAGADVVLPAANWLEQGGHYISLDGRVQEAHAALKPADEIWTVANTLQALADKFGVKIDGDWMKSIHETISPVEIVA